MGGWVSRSTSSPHEQPRTRAQASGHGERRTDAVEEPGLGHGAQAALEVHEEEARRECGLQKREGAQGGVRRNEQGKGGDGGHAEEAMKWQGEI